MASQEDIMSVYADFVKKLNTTKDETIAINKQELRDAIANALDGKPVADDVAKKLSEDQKERINTLVDYKLNPPEPVVEVQLPFDTQLSDKDIVSLAERLKPYLGIK